jgi:hypothetical protein
MKDMNYLRPRTTIALRTATKDRLDKSRAPGQCYDGFLCQLIELWEETHKENLHVTNSYRRKDSS